MKKAMLFIAAFLVLAGLAAAQADSTAFYIQKASTSYGQKLYRQSIEEYRAALRFSPKHTTVIFNIACNYSLLGDEKQALIWLNKAMDTGMYSFDADSDLDNIRQSKGYKKALARSAKLMQTVRDRVNQPVVLLPDGFDPGKKYPLLIAMHGFGGEPVNFSKAFKGAGNKKGYIVCCPYAPEVMGQASFNWGEWDQADKRIMETIVFLKGKYNIDEKRMIIAGFSQGGYYSYYLGLKHPDIFTGAIPIGPGFRPELDTMLSGAAAAKMKFYVLMGELEPEKRIDDNIRAIKQFTKAGITASFNFFSGVGHAFPGDAEFELIRAIEWIEKY
jgi:predicted esterase